MRSRSRLAFLLCSLLTVSLLLGGTLFAASSATGDKADDSPYKYLSVFMEVFGLATRAYVDEPKASSLLDGAFEGSIDALDPFSLYVPAEAVPTFEATRKVGSKLTGMLLLKERGVAYVVAVEPGSPAAKAGLLSGDILASVGGVRTREAPLYQTLSLLAGKPGTKLQIERLRFGTKANVELELAEHPPVAVELRAEKGLAILRIPSFHPGTPKDVEKSLETVVAPGEMLPGIEAHDKLVIDLRGTAGGDEKAAYAVAGLFADGKLGALLRRGEELETFKSGKSKSFVARLMLLTDRGTQGAAEVFATVLQQRAGAKLVGEESFGHAGRTELLALADGSKLQLTTAFFTGPDGKPLQEGLEPDERVRLLDDEEGKPPKDEVLDRALELLLAPPAPPAAEKAVA
jgi:carboxyl-terminal processing protease